MISSFLDWASYSTVKPLSLPLTHNSSVTKTKPLLSREAQSSFMSPMIPWSDTAILIHPIMISPQSLDAATTPALLSGLLLTPTPNTDEILSLLTDSSVHSNAILLVSPAFHLDMVMIMANGDAHRQQRWSWLMGMIIANGDDHS